MIQPNKSRANGPSDSLDSICHIARLANMPQVRRFAQHFPLKFLENFLCWKYAKLA
jgi:hypothetical protein